MYYGCTEITMPALYVQNFLNENDRIERGASGERLPKWVFKLHQSILYGFCKLVELCSRCCPVFLNRFAPVSSYHLWTNDNCGQHQALISFEEMQSKH